MEIAYQCSQCKKIETLKSNRHQCDCGGLFWLCYEAKPLDYEKILKQGIHSLWRYIDALPFEPGEEVVKEITMGEGMTPLFLLNPKEPNLLVKADYYMPTLSFKDRGATVLMAMAKKLEVKKVVVDSSGNAGTAIAAYAARVGIACDVYVPKATSEKKIKQICAHGANVHKIEGSREDTAKAAIEEVMTNKTFYASHIFNPLFYEGTKTYFFEVFEQMHYHMPDAFIIPTGNGTLLLGAYLAFKQMKEWKLISHMPTIIAVQAENCAPVKQAFENGWGHVEEVENKGTLAEGIAIAAPARGRHILEAIRATEGIVITVNEEEIAIARNKMATCGIYVEITSAANYAAYQKLITIDPRYQGKSIVMPLCGAGIKSS